jgi:hypothetical protein
LRRLDCEYPHVSSFKSSPSDAQSLVATEIPVGVKPNDITSRIPSWIFPVAHASDGQLSLEALELLHHYKTSTWQSFAIRGDATTYTLHRERVPQLSVSHSYLLYALLSTAASHINSLQPSKQREQQALVYRHKTFQSYSKELQNITSDNYETIIVTGTFLLALIPWPEKDAGDEEQLEWINSLLKLGEGLRILASLRWAQGIEKLSIYPLVCRELRTLPPPPLIITPDKIPLQTLAGPLGTTPDHPNPAPTYGLPYAIPFAGFVFLPPALMSLLEHIIHPPDSGPPDFDANALVPVFHVLSPIFLSLYYYHLNPDFNVRVFVFTSFLMPDFLALVKAREPRALTLIAWFSALGALVPTGWWIDTRMSDLVRALGRMIRQHGDVRIIEAFRGAEDVVEVLHGEGREKAAQNIFEGWDGVDWEEGPRKAQEWEANLLVGFVDDIGFKGLDLDVNIPA